MTRHTQTLRDHWRFTRENEQDFAAADKDDSHWQSVRVPHDWAIAGPFDIKNDAQEEIIWEDGERVPSWKHGRTGGLPHVGQGFYRQTLHIAEEDIGKRFRLECDGVMSHSQIFVNGNRVGAWPYGYSSFAYDITAQIHAGQNLLAISVDNPPLASRWYPGAGIYRNIRLVCLSETHIAHWGTRITTPQVAAASATVHMATNIDGPCDGITLHTRLIDPSGACVAESRTNAATVVEETLTVPHPARWSPATPQCYRAESTLYKDDNCIDTYVSKFGIRSIRFDAREGFFINEEALRFQGVCMHHDLGPLGAAVNRAALQRQLTLLQDMGCNAIRCTHNPPTPELLDLADDMGFLIINEAFDEWKAGKNQNGYQPLFDDWAEKDLRALIRRDANHPSVIMWSLGNEIREQFEADGHKVCTFLHDIAKDEDPTRPTTCGFQNPAAAVKNGLAAVVDIPGWNYEATRYGRYYNAYPDWPQYGAETASCISSRGIYHFPAGDERYSETTPLKTEDLQVSSYDLSAPNWAYCPDVEFRAVDENPNIMGEFVWTGFDYLGEPTPYNEEWPSRSSYFGIIDLCGIPKDRFYLYRSRWATDKTTLHLLPHWTWPGREGLCTPVHCYSSYACVELFINGVSQGRRAKRELNPMDRYRLCWNNVLYQAGELKAIAYDDEGNVVAECVVRTAGDASAIRLTLDKSTIHADGDDMAFALVEIIDADGNLCPQATDTVHFEIEGAAEIVALGNGDPTSLEPFQASSRSCFSGKIMVYLRSNNQEGAFTLRATGQNLIAATCSAEAVPV